MIQATANVFFDPNVCQNEREVESKFIVSYLLPKLGYDVTAWRQNYKSGRFRIDFVAYSESGSERTAKRVIIEAKHPGKRLPHGRYQLKNYMLRLGIEYGLLTNGRELAIYKWFGDNRVDPVFNCQVIDIANHIQEIMGLIGRPRALIANVPEAIAETTTAIVSLAEDASNNGTKEPLKIVVKETVEIATAEIVDDAAIVQEIPTASPDGPVSLIQDKPKQSPPDLGNMKILAVFHNKGGVGKTTTTVNLADAIARTGKKVLIIDMDSQANATFATGLMKFEDESTDDIKDAYVYHLLKNLKFFPISELARKANYSSKEIYVVPSHILLMEHEQELRNLGIAERVLLKKLEASRDDYDIVIIDTPPSLNLYARLSLIAADYLLIPSDLKAFANAGLKNVNGLLALANETKEMIGVPNVKVLGILPTKINSNPRHIERLKRQHIPKIEATYGIPVLKDLMILERVDVSGCLEGHVEVGELDIPDPRSIFEFKPSSPAVGEFEKLADYVLQQMGLGSQPIN